MPFNLFGKRKKYPFNKQKKDLAAGVYAGPEYFQRRSGRGRDEAAVRIYAGPEYFGLASDGDRDAGEVEIYAGPEYFERQLSPEEDAPPPPEESVPVYAGPEDVEALARELRALFDGVEEPEPVLKDHMEAMEDQLRMVYAGPEYFAERRRQAQQADECAGPEDAEETVRKNDAATEKTKVYPLPLYAGPTYIEDNPLTAFGGPKDLTERRRQAQKGDVYAGPEFFDERRRQAAERATEADRKADGKA